MIGHNMYRPQIYIIFTCDFHNRNTEIDIYWNFNSLAPSGTNDKRTLYYFGFMA